MMNGAVTGVLSMCPRRNWIKCPKLGLERGDRGLIGRKNAQNSQNGTDSGAGGAGQVKSPEVGLSLLNLDFEHFGGKTRAEAMPG